MNGITITLCIGKFGGFYATASTRVIRVCLGWIAITLYPMNDLERYIENLSEKAGKRIEVKKVQL